MVLSFNCILAQLQSFQSVHCYTSNWTMGKTTECRSVTGATKELTTGQKELKTTTRTKHKWNNELTTRKHETQTETGRAECAHAQHPTKQTTSTLRSNYHNTRHRLGWGGWGGSPHKQVEGMWMGGCAKGSWTSVPFTENSGVPFLRTYKVVFFIDTSAHNQLQC